MATGRGCSRCSNVSKAGTSPGSSSRISSAAFASLPPAHSPLLHSPRLTKHFFPIHALMTHGLNALPVDLHQDDIVVKIQLTTKVRLRLAGSDGQPLRCDIYHLHNSKDTLRVNTRGGPECTLKDVPVKEESERARPAKRSCHCRPAGRGWPRLLVKVVCIDHRDQIRAHPCCRTGAAGRCAGALGTRLEAWRAAEWCSRSLADPRGPCP